MTKHFFFPLSQSKQTTLSIMPLYFSSIIYLTNKVNRENANYIRFHFVTCFITAELIKIRTDKYMSCRHFFRERRIVKTEKIIYKSYGKFENKCFEIVKIRKIVKNHNILGPYHSWVCVRIPAIYEYNADIKFLRIFLVFFF